MNFSISTYEVKKGDTLESVSEKLGISAESLKRYHNTYCELKYLIEKDLKGISQIMIPPREKITELRENQRQTALSNNLPSFYLTKSFYASSYDVAERFEQQGQEDLFIDYSILVNLQEIPNKGFLAEVKTSDFNKNGQIPDDKISMLSLACTESISPVAFSVPAQGKIIGFYDHKNLIRKFENKKTDLEDFFIGEISTDYLNKFHSILIDEKLLLKQFHSTLLYQVLFPEIECFRRKKEWEESFYLVSNSFPVKCRFMTEHNFENPDDVEIIIKGEIEENCSLQELLRSTKSEELPEEKINGEIELRYTTTRETKQLKNAEASIILLHEGETYYKHNLTLNAKKEKVKKKYNFLAD